MPAETSPAAPDPARDPRMQPRAVRELGDMFDDVSARYDLLNRVMSLGRDAAWRRAMWHEVPESARVVLDLCCGSGTSLPGLRRPGRLVLGMDVSLAMLGLAAVELDTHGWAPRLACADAFRLPLPARALDAVTIAFGIRNLRPRADALAEIARVLAPGGRLVVLEAAAPRPGPLAPFHAFYLRRVVPFLGRWSSEPSAYAYLGRSILEFGDGTGFEADLARAGFEAVAKRTFLFGATALWVARLAGPDRGAVPDPDVQAARLGELARGEMRTAADPGGVAWRVWAGLQALLSGAVLASLIYAVALFAREGDRLVLEPWQRTSMRVLLGVAIAGFAIRTVILVVRSLGPPPRG